MKRIVQNREVPVGCRPQNQLVEQLVKSKIAGMGAEKTRLEAGVVY